MGRPKGAPNRLSSIVKQNIIDVFDLIGGTEGMVKWAKRNRREFYRLYARLLPTEIVGTLDMRNARQLTNDELLAIACGSGEGDVGETRSEDVIEHVYQVPRSGDCSGEAPSTVN